MHNAALTLRRTVAAISFLLLASFRVASQAPAKKPAPATRAQGASSDVKKEPAANTDKPAAAPAGNPGGGTNADAPSDPKSDQSQSSAPGRTTNSPSPDAKDSTPKDDRLPGRVVRLYHMREASTIAAAINKLDSAKGEVVEPLDNDQILILTQSEPRLAEIRRTIALLDLPRPQVALEVWSYQISSKPSKKEDDHKGANDVDQAFNGFLEKVSDTNDALETALAKGMRAVENDARGDGYFDEDFMGYLTGAYGDCLSKDRYCLGYTTALQLPIKGNKEVSTNASLNRFLLLLAAAKDDKIETAIRDMKSKMETGGPTFTRFFKQLEAWSDRSNLHTARAAILEFLFQYKLATLYPQDSSPYQLQQAAHALDNIVSPLVDAFGKDTDEYVECELNPVEPPCKTPKKEKGAKGTVSTLFGKVGVSTISGVQAKVEGKVSNYFDITEPPGLSDALANVSSKSTTSGLGAALGGILTDKEIAIAQFITNVASQQKVYAQVGKDASLTITPTSLDDASAAELDLQFDVKDDSAPASVNESTTKTDRLDRVAEHSVTDRVRVESLKLFQVSAFTMQLAHKSQPQCWAFSPLCVAWKAVAGGIPGLGNLLEVNPPPQVRNNESAAVVRAIVVPTAMDLGLSVRYERDRIYDPKLDGKVSVRPGSQEKGDVFEYHEKFLQCVVTASNCIAATKLSETHRDLSRKSAATRP